MSKLANVWVFSDNVERYAELMAALACGVSRFTLSYKAATRPISCKPWAPIR